MSDRKRHVRTLAILGGVAALALVVLLVVALRPSTPVGTVAPPPGPHKAGDAWIADLGGRTTMAMVWCPPGKFMMGSPFMEKDRFLSEIQHEVTLTHGFWLGQTEVTQEQWQALMGNNPSCFPRKRIVEKKFLQWEIPVWRDDFLVSRWRLPVEEVIWVDCQEFCRKAGSGFRLPTEAEWEYACRAGSTGAYAGTGALDDMGWYESNSGYKTHRVGNKRPNAWGLYDMHGNVYEWCQDYDGGDYPAGAATDPTGPSTGAGRVCRGGSWSEIARGCRAVRRNGGGSDCRSSDLGFRVAFAPASTVSEAK